MLLFVRLVQDDLVVYGYLMIIHGRLPWTNFIVHGRLGSTSTIIVYEHIFLFWGDSWSNLLYWLWTSHLDELEMNYFLLLHQLPLCSKGRPRHCCDFNKISLFRTPRVAKLLVGQSCRSRFLKELPRVNFWVASVVSLILLLGLINSAFSFMPLTFFSFSLLPSCPRASSSSRPSFIRYFLFLF